MEGPGGEGGIDSARGTAPHPCGAPPLRGDVQIRSANLSNRTGLIESPARPDENGPARGPFSSGGEGGIRTLDTLLTYTHFPGVRLQPLGHLSRKGGDPDQPHPAHDAAATVAPFRAWRGLQPVVAGGPEWVAIEPIKGAYPSGTACGWVAPISKAIAAAVGNEAVHARRRCGRD